MSNPNIANEPAWELPADYELRNRTEFDSVPIKEKAASPDDLAPPPLPSPTKNRKILLGIGIALAAFDLCILPITFFYSLTYGTSLSEQDGKQINITALQKLISLRSFHCHYLSLLHDDICALYPQMYSTHIQILGSIWTHWMGSEMATGKDFL